MAISLQAEDKEALLRKQVIQSSVGAFMICLGIYNVFLTLLRHKRLKESCTGCCLTKNKNPNRHARRGIRLPNCQTRHAGCVHWRRRVSTTSWKPPRTFKGLDPIQNRRMFGCGVKQMRLVVRDGHAYHEILDLERLVAIWGLSISIFSGFATSVKDAAVMLLSGSW